MHWFVCTPKYEYEEYTDGWILADRYLASDCVYVEATIKREAIIKGVKELKERSKRHPESWRYENNPKKYAFLGHGYYDWYYDKDGNPFTGVTAEKSVCEHGFCWCEEFEHEDQDDYCEECNKKYDEAYQQEIARENESSNTG